MAQDDWSGGYASYPEIEFSVSKKSFLTSSTSSELL